MRSLAGYGSGFLLGALLVWLASLVGGSPDSDTAATTTPPQPIPATTMAPTPWFESGEILIGPTVLLPRGFEVGDGTAVFRYETIGLGPGLIEHEDMPHQGEVVVLPEEWELVTRGGSVVTAVTGPQDQSVRFELPSAEEEVATVHLTRWRAAVPFGERLELPIETGASGSFRSGEVVIATVLDQRNSTIVQIDYDHFGDGRWLFGGFPRPLESRWRVSGREGGLQLIWDGDDAPDSVILEDTTVEMRPLDGRIPVFEEGAAR